MIRLGTTVARLKLKGIDGGPHKRWNMWFNSTLREKPYLGLTCLWSLQRCSFPRETLDICTGAAWLSSARVVRCWVKSYNERNPCYQLLLRKKALWWDCLGNQEEGGDDVKSAWSLCLGQHTCYNGQYKGLLNRKMELIPESWSKFRLRSATRPHEVEIASNRISERCGEYVLGPCTHRPSHHESCLYPKSS